MRIISTRRVKRVVRTFPDANLPTQKNLSSIAECFVSVMRKPSGSENVSTASANAIPCFLRFSICLEKSHSNSTIHGYHIYMDNAMHISGSKRGRRHRPCRTNAVQSAAANLNDGQGNEKPPCRTCTGDEAGSLISPPTEEAPGSVFRKPK